MLEVNETMNQTINELKVLRNQVKQLKEIVVGRDLQIRKLQKELSEVKQDRSNMLTEWAELDHYYAYHKVKKDDS
jgi:chromosome segregation ATPase